MGISKITAYLFNDAIKDNIFFGSILQLGKQDVYLDRNIYNKIFNQVNNKAIEIKAEEFFLNLGFCEVSSLDASGFEGADYIHDLNQKIPASLEEKFDCIFDGGTLEHVFNFPQALQNIDRMLKIGGHVIHNLPSNNHLDHGFYMFSPCALWDYYVANGYEIVKFYLYEYSINPSRLWATVYEYRPGEIDHLSIGGWKKHPISIWFVAKKSHANVTYIIPQQGYYQKIWKTEHEKSSTEIKNLYTLIKNFVKKNEILYRGLVKFYVLILRITDRRPKYKFQIK